MLRIATSVDSYFGDATYVPEPRVRVSTCSAVSSRSARLTVIRATLNSRASSFSDGTWSPSAHSPA